MILYIILIGLISIPFILAYIICKKDIPHGTSRKGYNRRQHHYSGRLAVSITKKEEKKETDDGYILDIPEWKIKAVEKELEKIDF